MKTFKEKLLPDRKKKDFNLKTIVGHRVAAYWPSTKKFHDGTVIGYNTDLTHNLIFYDEPTLNIPISCDFYKAFLFPVSATSKVEKWSLYSS